MGAKVKPLGLCDLLAPRFLAGVLEIFPDSLGGPPVLQHRDLTGHVFDITDLTLDSGCWFRARDRRT
jgi:hypothetical protein